MSLYDGTKNKSGNSEICTSVEMFRKTKCDISLVKDKYYYCTRHYSTFT